MGSLDFWSKYCSLFAFMANVAIFGLSVCFFFFFPTILDVLVCVNSSRRLGTKGKLVDLFLMARANVWE